MESTPLYNRFLEAARAEGRNEGWRYVVGFVITFFGYVVGQLPLLIVATTIGGFFMADPRLPKAILDPAALHISANFHLFLLLLFFVFGMLALWVTVRFLHRRRFITIITASKRIRWKRVLLAFGIWFAAQAVLLLLAMGSGDIVNVFSPGPFFGTLIICLLLLPIQTWWEEFFLRGYALQGIGVGTRTALVPWIITSVVFGCLHLLNSEVSANGVAVMLPQYIMPGLVFGLMTVLDEGQELAMGLHFANNLFGAVVITSANSSLRANTIFFQKTEHPQEELVFSIVVYLLLIALFWLIYRWDIKKLYR